jgi:hypothetical protein
VLPPALPRYGLDSLSELVPALLRAVGAVSFADAARLGLDEARSACLLLVDGLGDELLAAHRDVAPTLNAQRTAALTTGYPSTTATSLTSLGTGRTPGEHGMIGYLFEPYPGAGGLLNALRWQFQGQDRSALDTVLPEQLQPEATTFERAADAGLRVVSVSSPAFRESGLTRAGLRGGQYIGAPTWGTLVEYVISALRQPGFVYAYVSDLDTTGHVLGPGSSGWRAQLALVDQLVASLAESLPSDAILAVTGDHGMITATPEDRFNLDTPKLLAGVRAIAGEPRARYVYARQGAVDDVLDTWRSVLGEHAWVVATEQAIADGWFGPRVAPRVVHRLGDVIAAARGTTVLVRPDIEPRLTAMRGQHGSLTSAELNVPLVVIRG